MSVTKLLGEVVENLGRSLDDQGKAAAKENLTNLYRGRFGDVVPTTRARDAIEQNLSGTSDLTKVTEEEMFKGITGASEYNGNILTQAFNTSGGLGGLAAVGGGALLGGLGASATGGDYREGAAAGAFIVLGAAGAGRAIMKNIGSVEDNFMNSLLKGKTGVIEKDVEKSIESIAASRNKTAGEVTFGDLMDEGLGDKNMREIMGLDDNAIRKMHGQQQQSGLKVDFDDYKIGFDKKLNQMDDSIRGVNMDLDFKGIDPNDLNYANKATAKVKSSGEPLMNLNRNEKLNAVANLTSQEVKSAGFGAQYKQDVLLGKKDLNVAQTTRIAGFTGAALSGMGFSSKRRDHRRGFNKRRGNRV